MYLRRLPPYTREAILKVYKVHWGFEIKDILTHRMTFVVNQNPYEKIFDWLITYGLMTDNIRTELFPYLFGEDLTSID